MSETEHPGVPEVGDEFETVLVGYPAGNVLPVWGSGSEATYWRVPEAEGLIGLLGMGSVSRSEAVPSRYREAGFFNREHGTLMLAGRYRDADGNVVGSTLTLTPMAAGDARAFAGDVGEWALFQNLGDIVFAAVRRGEFVAIETGGWEIPDAPYVLMLAMHDEGPNWQSDVETAPVPRDVPLWRDQLQPPEDKAQVMRAPANIDNFKAAPHLARLAVEHWNLSPLELGLSFGPAPAGPWPG
jgi:hypothetical protein